MAKRELTERQREIARKAIKKHDTEKVDRVAVRLPKGSKDAILSTGRSVNSYVVEAVVERMSRDGLHIDRDVVK